MGKATEVLKGVFAQQKQDVEAKADRKVIEARQELLEHKNRIRDLLRSISEKEAAIQSLSRSVSQKEAEITNLRRSAVQKDATIRNLQQQQEAGILRRVAEHMLYLDRKVFCRKLSFCFHPEKNPSSV